MLRFPPQRKNTARRGPGILPFVMRARIFLCITLLYLCHPQLWPQAVTKQFPPAAGAANRQDALPDDPSASSDIPVAKVVPAPPTGVPVEIHADTQREQNNVYTLTGNVLIYYRSYAVQADRITYNRDTGEVAAEGHLIVDGSPDNEHITATHGEMNLDQDTAHFYDVVGTLGVSTAPGPHSRMVFTSPNPFAITGREVIKLGTGRYKVIDGTMTSCRLPKPDWRLLSKQINLTNGTASARNTWFQLLGMPLFYLPYVTHPVNEETRSSGVLLPIVGNSTTKGLILGEEVYFALSRNSDLTVGAEYFSKRGFSPMGMYRYRGFDENFLNVRFHSLLDRLPEAENQGGTDLLVDGRRDWGRHTRAVVDAEYLSSYAYRQAFEENYAIAINSEVKSQLFGAHALNGFSQDLRVDRYQSFQNSTTNAEIRILHLPALQLEGEDQYLPGTPLMWGGMASVAALSRSEPANALNTSTFKVHEVPRVDIYPHLALPFSRGGWTFRPEVALRDTFYGKSQNPAPLGVVPSERDASVNRKDFEAGIDLRPPAVERDFTAPWLVRLLGGDVRHTIEPDIQYHFVSGIDNFDSILRFDDVDIASDTSELDYSLTQRLFLRHLHPHPCKGDEALGPNDLCGGGTVDWLTWQVAQKYFFNTDFGGAVTTGTRNVLTTTLDLTGVAFLTGPRTFSPVISRLSMRTSSATNVQWDLDYDSRLGRITASNVYTQYKKGDYAFSVGDFHLNAPEAPAASQALQTTVTNPVSDYNQLRFSASYGTSAKAGLSAGTSIGYDFVQNQLQYGAGQAGYNWDCCGLSFEVRRYSLGTVRDDTQYLYSFTLAGVGSAGSLRRAARIF
jgi:LPS-assembly protein